MKKILSIALFAIIITTFAGCGGSSMNYPELYTNEGLPQYENAKITQIIKDGPTLKDGNLFILKSSDDVKTIAKYYDDKMTALGWTMPSKNEATQTSYATQYNKEGGKYVQLTVSQLTDGEQTISINFMQQ